MTVLGRYEKVQEGNGINRIRLEQVEAGKVKEGKGTRRVVNGQAITANKTV